MLPKVCEWTIIAFTKHHWILSIHSNFTNKNVSWLHFSWPTQYINVVLGVKPPRNWVIVSVFFDKYRRSDHNADHNPDLVNRLAHTVGSSYTSDPDCPWTVIIGLHMGPFSVDLCTHCRNVSPRTTKFVMVTRGEGRIYGNQPLHHPKWRRRGIWKISVTPRVHPNSLKLGMLTCVWTGVNLGVNHSPFQGDLIYARKETATTVCMMIELDERKFCNGWPLSYTGPKTWWQECWLTIRLR